MDILTDPAYRAVCDKAVWTVFQSAQPDFSYSAERAAFIDRYCGSRPLTINLLQHAWSDCKKKEALHLRDEALGILHEPPAPPNPSDLDSLDDGQLANIYHNTLSHYARSARRSTGMLG